MPHFNILHLRQLPQISILNAWQLPGRVHFVPMGFAMYLYIKVTTSIVFILYILVSEKEQTLVIAKVMNNLLDFEVGVVRGDERAAVHVWPCHVVTRSKQK